jgi:hypothetical protein
MGPVKEGSEVTHTNPVTKIQQQVIILKIDSPDSDVKVSPINSIDPRDDFMCPQQELSLEIGK